MSKTVYLIRHAKSSWADSSLRDIERPLNKRGLRDAPFMAKMLSGKGVVPDKIISSPATRAYTTAGFFAAEMGIAKKDIMVVKTIYEAYTHEVMSVIHGLDNSINTILLFGHNPTFTALSNLFSSNYIANVPTCGISKIESAVTDWSQFNETSAERTAFYYPKQYF